MADAPEPAEPKFASLLTAARALREAWSPRSALTVNQATLRVVKFQGHYPKWHAHELDECYVVLEGELLVELQGEASVHLCAGDAYVVRAGVIHRPFATPIARVLLVT